MSLPIVSHGRSLGHSHSYSYVEDNQTPSIRMARWRRTYHTLKLWICYTVLQNQNHQSQPVLSKAWCSHHKLGWKTGESSLTLVMRLGIELEIPVIYLPHHWAPIFIFYVLLHEVYEEWWAELSFNMRESDSTVNNFSVQAVWAGQVQDFCQYDSLSAKSF